MNEQMDLFEIEEANKLREKFERRYRLWEEMPDCIRIQDGTEERLRLDDEYCHGSEKWHVRGRILHECEEKPENINIWLNTVQMPEYWVLNDMDVKYSGEHILICPYCGADLENSGGDVVVYKNERACRVCGLEEESGRRVKLSLTL